MANAYQTIRELSNESTGFSTIDTNESLNQFVDRYVTDEQTQRDKEITELLKCYTNTYKTKSKTSQRYKSIIFYTSMIILMFFAVVFLLILWNFKNINDTDTINNIVSLITICITFLTLVISILKIITRYVFPQDEEEYITRIVKSIQDNDLENKKTNIESSKNNT